MEKFKISWEKLLERAYIYKYGSREEKEAVLLPYSYIVTDIRCGNYTAKKFYLTDRSPVIAVNEIYNVAFREA
jgi:hypothetical protein